MKKMFFNIFVILVIIVINAVLLFQSDYRTIMKANLNTCWCGTCDMFNNDPDKCFKLYDNYYTKCCYNDESKIPKANVFKSCLIIVILGMLSVGFLISIFIKKISKFISISGLVITLLTLLLLVVTLFL